MLKKAFVIGDPVSHSRSPLIHGYWLAKHGIEGSYAAIHVKQDGLRAFLAAMAKFEADSKTAQGSVKDLDSFKAAFGAMGKHCGSCHETYRTGN